MRFSKSWIVTKKDLSVFRKNKYILYSLVALPIIIGIVLPVTFIVALTAQAQAANLPASGDCGLRPIDIAKLWALSTSS